MGLLVYVPVDADPNQPAPTIDTEYEDFLVQARTRNEEEGDENPAPPVRGPGRRNRRNDDEEEDHFHLNRGWVEVMSFSHNVSATPSRSRYYRPHVGELTVTFFAGAHSIFYEGICVGQETLPHIVFRNIENTNGKFVCDEYSFEHARISNVSVSGGAGGRAVQTMSVTGFIFTRRHFVFNIEGQVLTNFFVRNDAAKDEPDRTRKNNHVKSLLDIAHQNINRNTLSTEQQELVKTLEKTPSEYTFATKYTPVNKNEDEDENEEGEEGADDDEDEDVFRSTSKKRITKRRTR